MLEFVGVVFLLLIGLVVAFFVVLYARFGSGLKQKAYVSAIDDAMDMPEVVLEPNEQPVFAKPEAVAELVEQAVRLGAMSCGNFDAPATGFRLCAFNMETPPVYIVVYDHDLLDPWTDIVVLLNEDRTFTASTAPEIGRNAPRPPEDEIIFFAPGTATGVLLREVAEHAKAGDALPAPAAAFKATFEAAAQKSQKYIQTQTVSQEWLATIADDAGVKLSGDEAVLINAGREAQQVLVTQEACIKSLARSGNFTAEQWDDMRDELVAVWDDMPGEYVAGIFYNHIEIPDELDTAVSELEAVCGHARERVTSVNEMMPEARRLVLIGTVSSPLEADIYRGRVPMV